MPKCTNTRKDKSTELMRLLNDGPSLGKIGQNTLTTEEAEDGYRIWAQSWVIPLVKKLVPELKEVGKP